MAATTWAQAVFLASSYVQREYIRRLIYQIDPYAAFMQGMPWKGGVTYDQEVRRAVDRAVAMTFSEAYTEHGVTFDEMNWFLSKIGHQETIELDKSSSMNRPDGSRNQDQIRKDALFEGLCLEWRRQNQVGTGCTNAVGATAVTKGIDGFIAGPRLVEFANVHTGGAVTTVLVYIDWDDTAKTMRVSLDGTNYGAAQTISGDLFEHPFYFDASELSWCRITFDFSDSDGNGDWTTTNAATGVTLTPSKEADGYLTQVHPDDHYYGNGSQDAPSANGDTLSADLLYWATNRLVRMAGGEKGRCIMAMRESALTRAWNILKGLATAEKVDTFMGMKLANTALAFNGVIMVNSDWLPDANSLGGDTAKARGSSANCTSILGSVFGVEEGNFFLYDTVANDDTIAMQATVESGGIVADHTRPGLPMFFCYRQVGEDLTHAKKALRIDTSLVFLSATPRSNICIDYITD